MAEEVADYKGEGKVVFGMQSGEFAEDRTYRPIDIANDRSVKC